MTGTMGPSKKVKERALFFFFNPLSSPAARDLMLWLERAVKEFGFWFIMECSLLEGEEGDGTFRICLKMRLVGRADTFLHLRFLLFYVVCMCVHL